MHNESIGMNECIKHSSYEHFFFEKET